MEDFSAFSKHMPVAVDDWRGDERFYDSHFFLLQDRQLFEILSPDLVDETRDFLHLLLQLFLVGETSKRAHRRGDTFTSRPATKLSRNFVLKMLSHLLKYLVSSTSCSELSFSLTMGSFAALVSKALNLLPFT